MNIGIVGLDPRIHELIAWALKLRHLTPVTLDKTPLKDISLLIIEPTYDRSMDATIRALHAQHIPIILLSFYQRADARLAEEINAPLFNMPFFDEPLGALIQTVGTMLLCARMEQRGVASLARLS